MKYGHWQPIHRCSSCSKVLSHTTIMYSGGVCPLCGASKLGTVVDYTLGSRRKSYSPRAKWWHIFRPWKWEYRDADNKEKPNE